MYRVAVTSPDDPSATFAYRLGRIDPGVHNHELHTGRTTPIDEFIAGLVEQAQAEYPDHEVRVERIVVDGDAATWIPDDEFDPERHTAVEPGVEKQATIHVTSEQQTGGES